MSELSAPSDELIDRLYADALLYQSMQVTRKLDEISRKSPHRPSTLDYAAGMTHFDCAMLASGKEVRRELAEWLVDWVADDTASQTQLYKYLLSVPNVDDLTARLKVEDIAEESAESRYDSLTQLLVDEHVDKFSELINKGLADDLDILDRHRKAIGDQLGEGGLMALAMAV